MAAGSRRIAHQLVRQRWVLLGIGLILAGSAVPASRRITIDRSIENMFAANDPLLPPYRLLREAFGGDEMVLVVYDDPQLFDPNGQGLARVQAASRSLATVAGVRAVFSLAEIGAALDRLQPGNLLGLQRSLPTIVGTSPLAQRVRDLCTGYTHGADGRTVAVTCMLEPQAPHARRATIARLRAIAQHWPQGQITGAPVMVVDGFDYLEQDGRRLGWVTMLLVATAIFVAFRSIRWVLIPVVVVQWTLLLTRAVLHWSGLKLTMVSSMLAAIVTVVGVATVVHIMLRFRRARRTGRTTVQAQFETLAALAIPVFWACATDAAGFAALLVARVGPVHDYGAAMAIGSIMVLVGVVLLVPALMLAGRFDTDPGQAWGEDRLTKGLAQSLRWVERHPRPLTALVLAATVGGIMGVFRLQIETDFTKNFRRTSPIARSYQLVERRLGGAGAWDIVLPVRDRLDQEFLDRVVQFEQRLRALQLAGCSVPALSKVISLADAAAVLQSNRLLSLLPVEALLAGMQQAMPSFAKAMYSRDLNGSPAYLRIMLRSRERQPARQKMQIIADVRALVQQEFPAGRVTGFFVLLSQLITSLLRDQWTCFSAAAVGVAGMMWLAFRSWRLALIALVPNTIPVVAVLGSMGWLGIPINMGAAMIAAVALGLSVDSSIHYIISFQRALGRGRSVAEALGEVQETVGLAVVFATTVLILGFAALCLSQFVPTIYFGALASLAMLGGLVGNLIVLPLLLHQLGPVPERAFAG